MSSGVSAPSTRTSSSGRARLPRAPRAAPPARTVSPGSTTPPGSDTWPPCRSAIGAHGQDDVRAITIRKKPRRPLRPQRNVFLCVLCGLCGSSRFGKTSSRPAALRIRARVEAGRPLTARDRREPRPARGPARGDRSSRRSRRSSRVDDDVARRSRARSSSPAQLLCGAGYELDRDRPARLPRR